jgi:formyltetrahydrofolate deformylase
MQGDLELRDAVIERRGARCALITTQGFRDVLELGRRDRPRMYGMTGVQQPLIPREMRWEVEERLDHTGQVLVPLDETRLRALAAALAAEEIEAVVVSFLHAYANPSHERRALEIAREIWPNPYITCGHHLLSESREFERGVTAAVNASVQPLLERYVTRLADDLAARGYARDLLVMNGNGGMVAASKVSREAVKTVIMVSKEGHCLNDLLFRWKSGLLKLDVRAIISNHRDFYQLAASYNVPFHHIPVTAATKADAEARQYEIIQSEGAELVVLARYMQILSDDLCRKLSGRAINIHHSFLPSFKGARPYHQAHARGVKLIGATAHYVTSDLDEGPILEQDVTRVTHRDDVAELTRRGRDLETVVLARAVRAHVEHRVLIWGNRSVVFS